MTIPLRWKRCVLAVLTIIAFVLQGTTGVLAGTTGTISGTVTDASTHQPISGASVTAQSPSQSVSTTTDGNGRYTFLSLNPDTYTLTVAGSWKYDTSSLAGVTVFADANQTVPLTQPSKLKVIGAVTSRAASSLVKPGTTADVYSISATQQDKVANVGGGGNLNSAWSAIATVPGVYIAPNQSGYIGAGSTLSIRGGDFDQVGYELDGVPVNRSFDNYPSGPASSLGQQELQVYTGANPANSEGEGISGYINQVIRTGTYPASRTLTLAAGAPSLYNKVSLEAAGANPARTLSYYFGAGAYNQAFRVFDNFNGASATSFAGGPLTTCPTDTNVGLVPSCVAPNGQPYWNNPAGVGASYVLGPATLDATSGVKVRDTVLNLHFGIPRKDGNKDDVQVLFDNNYINTQFYSSTNDQGGATFLNNAEVGVPNWTDSYQYGGPSGVPFQPAYAGFVQRYLYPNSPAGRPIGASVPFDQRDSIANDQGILKVQYQRNFGTKAFLRLYGYTYYSDWLQADPQVTFFNYLGSYGSPDYELSSHTRGVSATFSDQLSDKHLLSLQASYTTARTTRDNNQQMLNGSGAPNKRSTFLALVDGTGGTNGLCYTAGGAPTTCNVDVGNDQTSPFAPVMYTYRNVFRNGAPAVPASCAGCQFLVVGNGLYATFNTVVPKFSAASITDQWKPTDRLNLNFGVRFDRFEFDGANTTQNFARQFWYTAFNLDNCIGPDNNLFDKVRDLNLATPTAPCPAGYRSPNVRNASAQVMQYNEWQPRFGLTYTVDPRTVLRASYGRYVQAPSAAYEQYDGLGPNAPYLLYTQYNFQRLGFDTPGHPVRPPASNNYDFSLEHQFKGDTAVKITPFLRKTQDQIQQFFLDQKTSFVSGINVGRQTSRGVELEVDKGDFARDGWSGKLSFAYTNSYINYTKTAGGLSVIDPINSQIQQYNAYTSFCASHTGDARCGTTQGNTPPQPCYSAAHVGGACGAVDTSGQPINIANPYWFAPVQPLIDPNSNFPTYSTFPSGINSSYVSYGAPYVATLVVNYKKGPLAITPALQFLAGQRYGAPLAWPGVIPDSCTAGLGAPPDPIRYAGTGYGPGATGYDATTCSNTTNAGLQFAIPNPYSNRFDSIGSFLAPSNVLLHLQVSYQASKALTIVGNFANILNRCFGGSQMPWVRTNVCSYNVYPSGVSPVGNFYNPGAAIQPYTQFPYLPAYSGSTYGPQAPFNLFVEARLKI